MIKINDIEYRNLEEQVQKNKEDIAKHYQAMQLPLNLAGIEVVGSITNPSELDGVIGEKFGDAYVQVVNDDTILWVWTRANPDAGEDNAYWLNIPFTTVGEQGPVGPVGPKGEKGTRGATFFVGTIPPTQGNFVDGDIFYYNSPTTNLYGNIMRYNAAQQAWFAAGSIRGPQGERGPVGERGLRGPVGERGLQGPPGPISPGIVIHAIVNSVDDLPAPTVLNNLSVAYLVGKTLYIQIGETPSTAVWTNMGIFNGGTTVTVSGQPAITWNSGTKLDKVTSTGVLRVYAVGGQGNQEMLQVKQDVTGNSMARRNAQGRLAVANGASGTDAVNYQQLELAKNALYCHKITLPFHPNDTEYDPNVNVMVSIYSNTNKPYLSDTRPEANASFMESLIGQPLQSADDTNIYVMNGFGRVEGEYYTFDQISFRNRFDGRTFYIDFSEVYENIIYVTVAE